MLPQTPFLVIQRTYPPVTPTGYGYVMVEEVGIAGSGGAFCFGGAMSASAEPDWTAIRAEYEEGITPVAALLEKHGISMLALRRMRMAEGWPLRHTRPTGAAHDALIGQLFGLFENHLMQMSDLLEEDRAPDVQALGHMARTLDKLIELDTASRSAQRSKPSNPQLEDMRKRLSRRIFELEQQRA